MTPDRRATILIVDDEPLFRTELRECLESENAGYEVLEAGDGKAALDVIARRPVDLVLLDLQLPRVSGMEVLRRMADTNPGIPVVIVSGRGTIATAVEATQLGAVAFLEKYNEESTIRVVREALAAASERRTFDATRDDAWQRYRMIGVSASMQRLYRTVDQCASTEARVLLAGETGTGKDKLAHAIHRNSARASGPLIVVNCASLPEHLTDSHLFGHERGSFTGAIQQSHGYFEQASGGTLFLDEIGDMTMSTQAKVLRAIESRTIRRVGGQRDIPVDVRLVSATNKALEIEMDEGRFRRDLYFRLNVIRIELPALRARKDDIPTLVEHFLREVSRENRIPPKRITPGALRVLLSHDWPGNVRELSNVVERLCVLTSGDTIGAHDVEQRLRELVVTCEEEPSPLTLKAARVKSDREYIRDTLIAHDWKMQEAARSLDLDRTTLWRLVRRLRIEPPPSHPGPNGA